MLHCQRMRVTKEPAQDNAVLCLLRLKIFSSHFTMAAHHLAKGTLDLLDTIKQHFSKILAAISNNSRPSLNYIRDCLCQCSTRLPPSFLLTVS